MPKPRGRPPGVKRVESMRAAWLGMLASCRDTRHPLYSAIGAKGIRACAAWQESFCEFMLDMEPMPKGYVLQRIDARRDFEKSNCQWVHQDSRREGVIAGRGKQPAPNKHLPGPARIPQTAPTQVATAEENVPLSLHILQSHSQALVAFARSLRMSREDAEDLTQDTLLKAWAARDQFEPGSNLKAWLFTILRNCWYSNLRHRRAFDRIFPLLQDSGLSAECEAGDILDAEQLAARVERLPVHYRTVVLAFATGRRYEDLALELGIPDGTFKSRLHRAREALQA
jgi:RNA polymerase sigma-70 factor, ECF subfamily